MRWSDIASLLLILSAIGVWSALLWALPRMNWPYVPPPERSRRRPTKLRVITKTEEQEREIEESKENDPHAS